MHNKSLFLCSLFSIFCLNNIIYAQDGNFTVGPILNKNMQKEGYFDYKIKSQSKVKSSIVLLNRSNKTIKVKSSVTDAINDSGTIIYDKNISGSRIKLTDLVEGKINKINKLKPHSEKVINFSFKVPKLNNYNILGGISSYSKSDYGGLRYNNSVLMTKNVPSYDVKNMLIKNININNNNFKANINNNQNSLMLNNKINLKVFKDGELFQSLNKSHYSMISNSNDSLNFKLKNLNKGTYKFVLKITDPNSNKDKIIESYYSNNSVIKSNDIFLVIKGIIVCLFLVICYFIIIKFIKKRYF